MDHPSSTADRATVGGIAVDAIADAYVRRGIAEWSDVRLARAVAAVIAVPRRDPADSFVLHAALELEARLGLLPLVPVAKRDLARMHIVAIAAQYETYPPDDPAPGAHGAGPSAAALPSPVDPLAWLADSLAAGDLAEVDRAAVALAAGAPTSQRLGADLIDLLAPATAAAAHAPIFLYHLARVAPRSELTPALLRPLVRELARHPTWRVEWIDDHRPTVGTDARALEVALAELPIVGVPESTSIRPLLAQVDRTPDVVAAIGAAAGRHTPAAARALLRVAAHTMLAEPPDHAPYGWTHCLTMPQAVLGLAPVSRDPDRLLAIAASHVAGFRIAEATGPLALDAAADAHALDARSVDADTLDPGALATAAATSHDAHIVKYVLACLDACSTDPAATGLYLRAARRLLDVWRDLGGDPTDPLAGVSAG